MLPNDYDWHHLDIEIKYSKNKTKRICVTCGRPIYKTFQKEYVKSTGYLISKLCTWDQYYTCCEQCKNEWLENADERWLGIMGSREWYRDCKKASDPYLRKAGVEWGRRKP